jgi:hypothetical protein
MNEADSGAIGRGPGEGRTVDNPAGGPPTYKARSEQTGGALTVWESGAQPGHGPPLHVHVREDGFMYVLDGRLRFRLADACLKRPPARSYSSPKASLTPGRTWEEPARILFVFTPAAAGMERFFERGAELPDDTRMAEAFQSFSGDAGIEIVGPPLAQSHPKR